MTAWISPVGTVNDSPLRTGLSPAVAYKLRISSIDPGPIQNEEDIHHTKKTNFLWVPPDPPGEGGRRRGFSSLWTQCLCGKNHLLYPTLTSRETLRSFGA